MSSDRDDKLHHYQLMLELLEAYEQKQIDLRRLIDTLQSLLSVLENAPNDWRHDFYRSWDVLERAYTSTPLKPEEHPAVAPAISRLKELVRTQLRDVT